MNDVLIDLGFITIKWYSVLMLVALLIGIFMISKEAKRFNIDDNFITNLLFWTIIIGIIGNLLYAIQNVAEYIISGITRTIIIYIL